MKNKPTMAEKVIAIHQPQCLIRIAAMMQIMGCSRTRTYANLRLVGGQSLKIIHWAWHRLRYQQSGSSLIDYIKKNKLNQRTAAKQLRRKQMSAHWSRHFDNYYQNYWPEGWTVADYCRKEGLVQSSARRYLVDFPFIGLINPFVLKPWL
ncbi:hypothetical protein [Buttiauxella massiliensis]|uniref:hypothetical protein n=1 Tax=Buttiauxella massiliensis TaxID=2831590 RepID=UPI00125F8293|nr:hypothetical protein [Buttiauxella massiliensis]